MKKIVTSFFVMLLAGSVSAQWSEAPGGLAKSTGQKSRNVEMKSLSTSSTRNYYKLDISSIREQLKNAVEMGPSAKPVVISMPTIGGKIQKFNVYSFPVVVKELADQYELGSYIGTAVDDPTQLIRFSVAPNDLQSMLFRNGQYEFIEPVDKSVGLYGIHPKSGNTSGKPFVCSTDEKLSNIKELEDLAKNGNAFTHNPTEFSKNSDKKYSTMRLAMSVTGEYTQYFGGTVAGALTAINATMTRVNGVFEKDFALHLNVQNFPAVIYTDATTDPYSPAATGAAGAWNQELQTVLTNNVGNTNYDIGHLFGASGGGGNAGCIGCVCINPTTSVPKGKGSGYTSPADAIPQGDNFDIDYVAHEMGHQLGANHTFSHGIEGSGVNVEPGSGSTIMGYAGITGANTDVQPHSDAYFHKASIGQVQTNLINKNCDVETAIANNPPVIPALPSYTIPKKTAFVLTAAVTDPENDPMTYTWEQVDSGMTSAQAINKTNLGTTTYGASFRSLLPTTSPTRYFPKFSSVLAGVLDNSLNTWESTSQVARNSNFALTVRDNNSNIAQQQTSTATQAITVGADGPFQITTGYLFSNGASNLTWDVANTAAAPYNVANVKIDYSTDNGVTWTVLSATTPNDGSESYTLPTTLNGQTIAVRISSIGNVFYALKKITISTQVSCGAAPSGIVVSNITSSTANVTWAPVSGAASYVIQYRKVGTATWTQTTSTTNTVSLSGLLDASAYEVQVASVCSGVTGPFSASTNFSTLSLTYCALASNDDSYEYISNVTVANLNNSSLESTYTDYTTNPALQVNLVAGNSYPLTVTVGDPDTDYVGVWIDFNRNSIFEQSERVLNFPVAQITGPITSNFTVPNNAFLNGPLRMRVMLYYASSLGGYFNDGPCGLFSYGEVEDYNVVITSSLSTSEVQLNNGINIYPNPATDVLNVTKVSDKATYKIYAATGQIAGQGNISNGKIDVSSLVKGVYVISISDKGNEVLNSKFIKK